MNDKVYCYLEPGKHWTQDVLCEVTGKDILEKYWHIWKPLMDKKYGPDYHLTTPETCIEDFITVHWAWEKKQDEK